jgi:hypothetical protein
MGLPQTLPIKRIGIAAAILLASACLPGQAKAECGDYVHIRTGTSSEGDSTAPVKNAPCDGPHCSGKPATPTPPVTVPISNTEINEFLAARFTDHDEDDNRESHARDLAANLPDPILSAIFHPPRAI